MKKSLPGTISLLMITLLFGLQWAISSDSKTERERRNMVDTRVDNNGYYKRMAAKGLYTLNPEIRTKEAIFTGSAIKAFSVVTEDSPDIAVTNQSSTQSENSVFVSPLDNKVILNSNNSTDASASTLYGANDFYSFDSGETWAGKIQGAAGSNSGDPATIIGWNGRWYINYISSPGGQGIAYSDNNGANWTARTISPNPGDLADKNNLWIDNSLTSPYEGNLYNVWTDFGGLYDTEIVVSRSTNDGETWSTRTPISSAINAGSHNQGVNVHTGPNGEVYAVWAIYNSWPSDEGALGFAKSLDGGVTWLPATRIIQNIRGIRTTETKKNHRVNSFPSMAVDISDGPDKGTIYVVWANIGIPGINQNQGIDVYLIKSTDIGSTWSAPVRVNQNVYGQGKEHYFPWIACDPENGIISVIFYGDRNVTQTQNEVFCSNSSDGGETWEDFKVSDVAFTPAPIPGLADGYMGDYLGISARGGIVYPVWTDNRSGITMSYTSPYETNPLSRPFNLVGSIDFLSGNADLSWEYETAPDFTGFNIYRDNVLIGTTQSNNYINQLPDYGFYAYAVTATYTDNRESGAIRVTLQWGEALIAIQPDTIIKQLQPDSVATQVVQVSNIGQLPLDYSITSEIINPTREINTYCTASGGGDEYISAVQIGTITNSSGSSDYADYTNLSTVVKSGEPLTLTVTNGNSYTGDQCGVWIDWNQNDVFDDEAVVVTGSPGIGPYSAIIEPPAGAKPGPTRMRVRLTWTGSVEPCGTTTYGEVEDYTLNVVSWMTYTPAAGTILPGESASISLFFNAEDLVIGTYKSNLVFTSNDAHKPSVEVPVTLNVETLIICYPEPRNLSSDVNGQSITLNWLEPDPDLSSSGCTSGELIGYHIYRDGAYIGNTDANVLTFLQSNVTPGSYVYGVASVYGEPYAGESGLITTNVVIQQSTLTVSPSNQNVTPAAGNTSFDLTSNTSWTVLENVSWLTASPLSGNGNGSLSISFDANTTGNIRTGQIVISAGSGSPIVSVTVTQSEQQECLPLWEPVTNLQYNMQLVAQILINGQVSLNPNDVLGAFVGNECRGIASPQPDNNGLVFLTVCSNVASGEQVELKIWNSNICSECDAIPGFTFVNQTEIGTSLQPYEVSCGAAQNLSFGQGFTWFSLNVNPGSMSPNNLFTALTPCYDDRVIGQTSFALYTGSNWMGSLSNLGLDKMYRMKLCSAQSLSLMGDAAPLNPINLAAGYTWLGYQPQECQSVSTAMAGLSPGPAYDDRVIGQSSFALYTGTTWIGSLTQMCPGKGYVVKLANAQTLTYPAVNAKEYSVLDEALISPTGVYPAEHLQHSMMVVAKLQLPYGMLSLNEKDVIYAYIEGEVRAIGHPMTGADGTIFLSIAENTEQPKPITFMVWLDEQQQLLPLNETLSFEPLAAVGELNDPIILTLGEMLGVNEMTDGIWIGEPFPNPFEGQTTVPYFLNEATELSFSIYDSRGVKARAESSFTSDKGHQQFSIERTGLAKGVYVLEVSIESINGLRIKRMKLIVQ